jgi:hypothetical protein
LAAAGAARWLAVPQPGASPNKAKACDMDSATHYWRFEQGGSAELEPPDGCQPPMLFLAPGAGSEEWITLMPPMSRADISAFDQFLASLAEAVNGLRLMCHPDGEWGRRVLADAVCHLDGGVGDDVGGARSGCSAERRGGSVAVACLDSIDPCRCGR